MRQRRPARKTVPPGGARPPTTKPARVGKHQVALYVAPEVRRALKLLAVERDSTIQALMTEALSDLLAKYRRRSIA